jgi:hypothetical protein
MRNNPHPCIFCDRPVLGLLGQDEYLDSALLSDSVSDRRVLEEGLFGDAHASCLQDSDWTEFWVQKQWDQAVEMFQATPLDVSPAILAARLPRSGELILSDRVRVARLEEHEFLKGREEGDSYVTPVHYELNLRLRPQTQQLKALQDDMLKGRFPSLMNLVVAFGAQDRLYQPAAIEGGKVQPIEDDPEATFESLADGYLDVQVEHALHMPGAFAAVVQQI